MYIISIICPKIKYLTFTVYHPFLQGLCFLAVWVQASCGSWRRRARGRFGFRNGLEVFGQRPVPAARARDTVMEICQNSWKVMK